MTKIFFIVIFFSQAYLYLALLTLTFSLININASNFNIIIASKILAHILHARSRYIYIRVCPLQGKCMRACTRTQRERYPCTYS